MRKIYYLITAFLFITLTTMGQGGVSNTVAVFPDVKDYVDNYVIPKVEQWQKQDRYESTIEFQARVTEQTRNAMIKQLTDEAVAEYKAKLLKAVNWNHLKIKGYDADNETFLISSHFGDFTLEVPRKAAQGFETGFKNTKMSNPDFYFTDTDIKLEKLTFTTNSGETYVYNSNDPRRFEPVLVSADFGAIRTNIPTTGGKGTAIYDPKAVTIGRSDVDRDIPITSTKSKNTYAVIICNENYDYESNVDFAKNDGATFKEYCIKTLGIPEEHIHYVENATLNNINREIRWISDIANEDNGKGNIVFYYAGHGIPDENSKTAYLLPVDGYATDINTGYKLDNIYERFGRLNVKSAVVFLDACFSGSQREDKMLASARGIAIKIKQGIPSGNTIVFSAAQGDESAYPYKEMGHGMFTYFLLKKLQETKGEVSLLELDQYITSSVRKQSLLINSKSQTPIATASPTLGETWKTMKLK